MLSFILTSNLIFKVSHILEKMWHLQSTLQRLKFLCGENHDDVLSINVLFISITFTAFDATSLPNEHR